jgi:hypothetical protein
MVTLFRTYDTFNIENDEKRNEFLKKCLRAALKSGLSCGYVMDGTKTRLHMNGTKKQFIKYYLNTISYNESFTNAVRRLINCISWK